MNPAHSVAGNKTGLQKLELIEIYRFVKLAKICIVIRQDLDCILLQ